MLTFSELPLAVSSVATAQLADLLGASQAHFLIPFAWLRKLNSVEKKQEVTSVTSVACVSVKPGISLRVTDCAGANGFQWEIEGIQDLYSSHVSLSCGFRNFGLCPGKLGYHRLERSRCFRLEGRTSRQEVAATRSYTHATPRGDILKI